MKQNGQSPWRHRETSRVGRQPIAIAGVDTMHQVAINTLGENNKATERDAKCVGRSRSVILDEWGCQGRPLG